MQSQYVWALLGLLCLFIMFAMMAAGMRAVKDETYSEGAASTEETHPHE
jgi:hypothetical protein